MKCNGHFSVVVRLGEYDITKKEDCSPLIGCIKAEDYIIEKIVPHEDYRQKDKSKYTKIQIKYIIYEFILNFCG